MRLFLSSHRKFFLLFAIAAIAGLSLVLMAGIYIATAQTDDEPFKFVEPELKVSIKEDVSKGTEVATYTAIDPEGNDVSYYLPIEAHDGKDVRDGKAFEISKETGVLKTVQEFDFETKTPCVKCTVAVGAIAGRKHAIILVEISVTNVNDEPPEFGSRNLVVRIPEGVKIGTEVATITAIDPDGDDIVYDLSGTDAEWFELSKTGALTTKVHFDFETGTPCLTCVVVITADDGLHRLAIIDVVIYVYDVKDFTNTVKVSKANPVPGAQQGNPEHALDGDPEKPENYVKAVYANWDTILRFEVTSQSPDPNCGKGNDCVFLSVQSGDAGAERELMAMRSAAQGELFVTAAKLVETGTTNDESVAIVGSDGERRLANLLEVDAQDHIAIKFADVRLTIYVENDLPKFSDFNYTRREVEGDGSSVPEELEVDFVFEVSDSGSGLPQPEDLPDADGDDDYISVVALVHDSQCYYSPQSGESLEAVNNLIMRGGAIYCEGQPEVRPITDDRDFHEIDGPGYEIRTTLVLPAETDSYVTFVVCDNAGNCTAYDRVRSDDAVLLRTSKIEIMPPGDPCLEPIVDDSAVKGSMDTACPSTNKGGSYARYYTFELDARSDVTINLSSKQDAYLLLLGGAGRAGKIVASNDDIVPGNNRNSRIQTTLDAGDYTIEATTYDPGVTSDFTLRLDILEPDVERPSSGSYTALTMGELHTCGLRADAKVVCWGNDEHGQVSGAPQGRFRQIAAAPHHTCAIGEDGTVACWGKDDYNQASGAPAGEFVSIAVSAYHNCGIRTDGIVVCWGRNDYGQSTPP